MREVEYRLLEIILSEEKRKEEEKNSEESLRGLRDIMKHYGNHLDGEKRGSLFKETIIENFPNMRKMDIHFQEAQKHQTRWVQIYTDSQCNQKVKKKKLKTDNFESNKRKIWLMYKIRPHKIISGFFQQKPYRAEGSGMAY